ncbi:MAG TPA: ectonucleotide pyrophosphatase/phosphodiesterase, partial [Opitutaceae bacterium]|nr:ectonucleotide pyrophosphatase/phosphodiesterase [Opitutaceae bacterium]
MKSICPYLARLAGLFALGCTVLSAADRKPIVILISIDGLAAYHFDDPKADMPMIRSMAARGARAESMETSFPSVTWPTHTTLVTGVSPGRHGVLGNAYWDRAQAKRIPLLPDPLFDKEELVKAPTIYDAAHLAGLKTSGVNWPASRNAKHLDWQMPDVGDQAIYEKSSTPSLVAELRAKGIPIEKQAEWAKAGMVSKAMRDWMYTRVAEHILQKHQPNLLVIHYVNVDSAAHTYGSRSPETHWAVNDNDQRVRELVETVTAAGLADRTTFFVTADHGFADYSKNINVNVLLREKGFFASATDRKVMFLAEGGAGLIYIRDRAHRERILAELVPALKGVEGIEAVIPASDFATVGHLSPDQNPNEPDLMVAAAAGYSFADNPASKELIVPTGSVKGTHGAHSKNHLMDATFVAWGAAIKPGVKLGHIRNVDVAPTMAAVLGIKMENV